MNTEKPLFINHEKPCILAFMSIPYQKEQLFERMPILAAVLDRDGHFLAVSDKWVERIGYTAAELRGRAPHEIATPESAIRFSQEYLPGFRRTGKLDHVAVGFIAKDGTTLELLMKTRAVYDDDQQQLYSIFEGGWRTLDFLRNGLSESPEVQW